MNGQNMAEPEPELLDVLDHFIETTTAQLVHWIDRLHDLVVDKGCTLEAMRIIVIVERALSRLIDERDLLSPSELSA